MVCGEQKFGLFPVTISPDDPPIPEQIPEGPMEHNHMILAKDLKIPDPTDKHWELKKVPKDTR